MQKRCDQGFKHVSKILGCYRFLMRCCNPWRQRPLLNPNLCPHRSLVFWIDLGKNISFVGLVFGVYSPLHNRCSEQANCLEFPEDFEEFQAYVSQSSACEVEVRCQSIVCFCLSSKYFWSCNKYYITLFRYDIVLDIHL